MGWVLYKSLFISTSCIVVWSYIFIIVCCVSFLLLLSDYLFLQWTSRFLTLVGFILSSVLPFRSRIHFISSSGHSVLAVAERRLWCVWAELCVNVCCRTHCGRFLIVLSFSNTSRQFVRIRSFCRALLMTLEANLDCPSQLHDRRSLVTFAHKYVFD